MVTFKTLKIKNFKSIKEAEISYTAGVWNVVGVNNDTVFASNGSGKTTALEAIQQCLFNKTTSPTPIDDTSRKSLGTKNIKRAGYRLELNFTKGDDDYTVVNDREAMRIQVFMNGKDLMLKSIPNSLRYITEIIGMDFSTFVTLTFINHDTIVDLLDNFSSSSLMKVILNFAQIAEFEKTSKSENKVLNGKLLGLQGQIQTVNDSLDVLGKYVEIDTNPMHLEKVRLLRAKLDAEETMLTSILEVEAALDKETNEIEELTKSHAKLTAKFNASQCDCCGALVELSAEVREQLLKDIASLDHGITERLGNIAPKVAANDAKRGTFHTTISEINQALEDNDRRLVVAQTKNELFLENKDQLDALRQKLFDLEKEHTNITFEITVIQTALQVIKSGDIQKDLLSTFVAVLNVHLIKFLQFVSLDYISIQAEASKANVSFKIFDNRFNHDISVHTLSGGEKTRLRLVVLLAMLQTIKELASTATNIVIFDESLDTLDASAAKDLANLFDYSVHQDNKFIALVSHGDQLNEIEFKGKITAEKSDGITKIIKESYV